MRRDTIDFDAFKTHFIDAEWGFFPVYSAITENDDGDCEKSVDIDLICEWRLTDGKIKFIVVPFDTKEQLAQIRTWLLNGAEALKNEIVSHVIKNVNAEELFGE